MALNPRAYVEPDMTVTYDGDFYSWTQEQARLLREGRFDRLDVDHLAEEIEDMGKSQRRELSSRLAVVICHLLKLQFQTDRTPSNEKSWRRSVRDQRQALLVHLEENPGLKNPDIMARALAFAWVDGVRVALRETELDPDIFPDVNPYTIETLLDGNYWPDGGMVSNEARRATE